MKKDADKKSIEQKVDEIKSTVDSEKYYVRNEEAYQLWLTKMQSKILNEKRTFEASDGRYVDLGWLPHILKKKLEGLPHDEQETILKKKGVYQQVMSKANVQKRMAFGVKDGWTKTKKALPSIVDNRKEEMLELFGRLFSVEEVHKVVVEDFKLPCNVATIYEFKRRHISIINEKVEAFKKDYADIRLGYKRSRLEELVWMYNKLKNKYEVSGMRGDHQTLLQTLEQIRKESEGDKFTLDGQLDMSIEQTVSIQIEKDNMKKVSLKEIILGRVASRMDLPAEKLIEALNNSYYRKFTGITEDLDESQYKDLSYPSESSYDFDRLEKEHVKADENMIIEEQMEKERRKSDIEAAKDSDLKNILLEKMRAKQKSIQQRKNDVVLAQIEKKRDLADSAIEPEEEEKPKRDEDEDRVS